MQSLLNNMCFYNIWQRSRRVWVRMMGVIVALFASNRTDAAALTVQTLCPKCQTVGNAICNTGAGIYNWTSYGGNFREMQFCLPVGNQGSTNPAINDSACVQKLKNWGLCQTALGGGRYELHNQNLNCTAGQVDYNGTYAVEYYPNQSQFGYSTAPGGVPLPWISVTGWTSPSYGTILGMGDGFPAVCCVVSGTATCGMCWVVNNVSPNDCNILVECGLVSSNSSWSGYPIISHSGAAATNACPKILQDYFNGSSNGKSTGYCSGNDIYADGLETMLIAQACNGETSFSHCYSGTTNFLNCACGFMAVSCQYDSGYYWTGHSNDPLNERDPQAFCESCETGVSGYSTSHDFDIYAVEPGTGGRHGIHTCTAHANNPTADSAYQDLTGTFTITITDDCPYMDGVVDKDYEIIK